jgi:hypothetical protein
MSPFGCWGRLLPDSGCPMSRIDILFVLSISCCVAPLHFITVGRRTSLDMSKGCGWRSSRMTMTGGPDAATKFEPRLPIVADTVEKSRDNSWFLLSGGVFGLFMTGRRSLIGKPHDQPGKPFKPSPHRPRLLAGRRDAALRGLSSHSSRLSARAYDRQPQPIG